MTKNEQKNVRIREIRDKFCDGNNLKFAQKLQIVPQTASNYCNGQRSVTDKFIEKVLIAFPMVSRTWIYLGVGGMIDSKEEQDSLTTDKYFGLDIPKLIELLHEKDNVILKQQAEIKELLERQQSLIDKLLEHK